MQLSSAVASYNQISSSSSPTGSAASNAENYKSCTSAGKLKSSSTVESTPNFQVDYFQEGSVSTSSISEYLIETLPGWHVEDFLEYPCSSPYEF